MDEPLEQHDAATRYSLHQFAVALAHLWVTNAYLNIRQLPTPSTYFVYSKTLGWGDRFLEAQRKRIKVTIKIEEF